MSLPRVLMSGLRCLPAAVVLCAAPSLLARTTVDYGAIFDQGISYETFLKDVRARRDEWRAISNKMGLIDEIDLRKLQKRRLLIVTEDWCSDSVQTVPYIYLAVKNHPGVTIRIVNSTVGRPIMEAHRTPDDRAATPTVVALDEHNQFLGAWVERPAALQALVLEQQKVRMRRQVTEIKMTWYEKDAGRSTVSEVMALFEKSR
jgi:Thioredoxin